MRRALGCLLLLLWSCGPGSAPIGDRGPAGAVDGGPSSSDGGSDAGAGADGGVEPADAGGAGGGGGATDAGDRDGGTPVLPPLAAVGTLVVLGDSISDRGGTPPYYYDRLRTALGARFPGLAYRRQAQSGSRTDALAGQVDALPATLRGPVAVVITSGGNDMRYAAPVIAAGQDGPLLPVFRGQIKAALDKLTAPGRFGPGVQVAVYEANVYDSSDGAGDYALHGCRVPYPVQATDQHFADWNAQIAAELADHGQQLVDLHAHFRGHGVASANNWYAGDCIHPNATGHLELYRLFYSTMTGLPPP